MSRAKPLDASVGHSMPVVPGAHPQRVSQGFHREAMDVNARPRTPETARAPAPARSAAQKTRAVRSTVAEALVADRPGANP